MKLDDYSQIVSDRVLREFPQLRSAVKPAHTPGCLLIEFPSPHADVSLYVSTENEEITIGLDHWHEHIGTPAQSPADELDEAVALIGAILRDELVIEVLTRNGKWVQSSIAQIGNNRELEKGEHLSLVRWSGISTRTG